MRPSQRPKAVALAAAICLGACEARRLLVDERGDVDGLQKAWHPPAFARSTRPGLAVSSADCAPAAPASAPEIVRTVPQAHVPAREVSDVDPALDQPEHVDGELRPAELEEVPHRVVPVRDGDRGRCRCCRRRTRKSSPATSARAPKIPSSPATRARVSRTFLNRRLNTIAAADDDREDDRAWGAARPPGSRRWIFASPARRFTSASASSSFRCLAPSGASV